LLDGPGLRVWVSGVLHAKKNAVGASFAVLNGLSECEEAVLQEFAQCEQISREQHFEPALKHLDLSKKDALTYRQKQRKRNTKAVT
jgi:hypothetical protein